MIKWAVLLGAVFTVAILAACGGSVAESSPSGTNVGGGPVTNGERTQPSTEETAESPPFEDVVRTVRSGVIRIRAKTCAGVQEGTGILVGPRLVATAEHVIDGAVTVDLRQAGESVGQGTVIGYDVERDIALIRSDNSIGGHQFEFAARASRPGEAVAAIGFPLGLGSTVTQGLVSGLNRKIEIDGIVRRRLIQTDAAVNPGSSGGPLLAVGTGEVLGIVSAGSPEANAIAFAVPARTASALIAAWQNSPQPVAASSCGGSESAPSEAPSSGDEGETFSGYFTSYDRLETCYADDFEAFCVSLPSGKSATLTVGVGAAPGEPVIGADDMGGPPLQLGESFTTPAGSLSCDSSSRGITCTDLTTGSYFVSGDYEVKINNGAGEESY
jgi:S1-C subfamily serine protease